MQHRKTEHIKYVGTISLCRLEKNVGINILNIKLNMKFDEKTYLLKSMEKNEKTLRTSKMKYYTKKNRDNFKISEDFNMKFSLFLKFSLNFL